MLNIYEGRKSNFHTSEKFKMISARNRSCLGSCPSLVDFFNFNKISTGGRSGNQSFCRIFRALQMRQKNSGITKVYVETWEFEFISKLFATFQSDAFCSSALWSRFCCEFSLINCSDLHKRIPWKDVWSSMLVAYRLLSQKYFNFSNLIKVSSALCNKFLKISSWRSTSIPSWTKLTRTW